MDMGALGEENSPAMRTDPTMGTVDGRYPRYLTVVYVVQFPSISPHCIVSSHTNTFPWLSPAAIVSPE